jgi:sulfur carrier protein
MLTLTVNGKAEEHDADALTVTQLLAHHDLSSQPVAVEVNRQLVPKRDHGTTTLQPGDTVELVTLVGGG